MATSISKSPNRWCMAAEPSMMGDRNAHAADADHAGCLPFHRQTPVEQRGRFRVCGSLTECAVYCDAALLFVLQREGKALLPWCIAVLLTPLLQGFVFLIVAPLAWWAGRRMTA